jgi:hypothetical protein
MPHGRAIRSAAAADDDGDRELVQQFREFIMSIATVATPPRYRASRAGHNRPLAIAALIAVTFFIVAAVRTFR